MALLIYLILFGTVVLLLFLLFVRSVCAISFVPVRSVVAWALAVRNVDCVADGASPTTLQQFLSTSVADEAVFRSIVQSRAIRGITPLDIYLNFSTVAYSSFLLLPR